MHLSTPRLLLRELEEDDWPATHAYESDPEVVRYQSFDVYTEEQSRDYLRRARRDRAEHPRRTYDLAVTLVDGGELIGRAGLHVANPTHREATIWYIFHRRWWGRGYATEAAGALLELGFGELALHRIVGDCDPRNPASARVMEKLGMRREAHFVENVFLKGEWCDSFIYAILDREWRPAHGR